jgi:hypothetical protein
MLNAPRFVIDGSDLLGNGKTGYITFPAFDGYLKSNATLRIGDRHDPA